MFSNRSDRALRRVLAVGVLAFNAGVAQAGPAMPEQFAQLEPQQVALACVVAMNARGEQVMHNEDSTTGERLTALQQYMFARRVWMLDVVDEASLDHWKREFESQGAAERSAQTGYCFDAAAARVDVLREFEVSQLRVESYATAQAIWNENRANARIGSERVGALTR